jgi:hypothetical protein
MHIHFHTIFFQPHTLTYTHIHTQGTNGRWQGVLTPAQLERYDAVVAQKLVPECAAWLAHGKGMGMGKGEGTGEA